jgi:hypothetical protein
MYTGRVCCGVELDRLYVDVVIRRYEASTGMAAILVDSGETFEQVATRRCDDERRSRLAASRIPEWTDPRGIRHHYSQNTPWRSHRAAINPSSTS